MNEIDAIAKLFTVINNMTQSDAQKFLFPEYRGKYFKRVKQMVFSDFIKFMLDKMGLSTTVGLEHFFYDVKPGVNAVTKGNYSRRRVTIDPKIFIHLNDLLLSFLDCYFVKKAADGTLVELPGCKTLKREFDYNSGKDTNTARARAEIIIDVESKLILRASINETTIGERELLNELMDELEEKGIIILDRGYYGIEQFIKFELASEIYIARIPKNVFKKEISVLTGDDAIFTLDRARLSRMTDKKLRDKFLENHTELKIRMIRSKRNGSEERIILTNDFTSPKEVIESNYVDRWTVETVIHSFKNKHQVENFGGRRKVVIEQEFYASILIYNISTLLTNFANKEIAMENDETNTIKSKKKLYAKILKKALNT